MVKAKITSVVQSEVANVMLNFLQSGVPKVKTDEDGRLRAEAKFESGVCVYIVLTTKESFLEADETRAIRKIAKIKADRFTAKLHRACQVFHEQCRYGSLVATLEHSAGQIVLLDLDDTNLLRPSK